MFFVRAALALNCGIGEYIHFNSSTCEPCPPQCDPGTHFTNFGCLSCFSNGQGVGTCPENTTGTNKFCCPGVDIDDADLPTQAHEGLFECTPAFPEVDPFTQKPERCYTDFQFWPGKGATFRGDYYTDDDISRRIEPMYRMDDSAMFKHTGNGKHVLQEQFLAGGSDVPTKDNYIFADWVWNGTTINQDTIITPGADQNIYAKWKYKVQYSDGAGHLSQIFLVMSGATHTVQKNTDLIVYNSDGLTPVSPPQTLTIPGKIFVGWCINNTMCSSSSELVMPGQTICDVDNCGNRKVEPATGGIVTLYAQFIDCAPDLNRVADVAKNKCVCKKGFYEQPGTGEDQACSPCGNNMTTEETDAQNAAACKLIFKYGNKTWQWPVGNTIDSNTTITNVYH